MANYPTPHISAKPGDFGQTVLMPGDPLRAKFIAENFLKNPVLVNNVRGVQGYTGTYDGVKISVMASGMGMPSIGIYSWELYTVFGVENIMRIGSTGALQDNIKLRDIVIGQGACTDSNWASQYHLAGMFAPIADFHMLETCVETAKEMGRCVSRWQHFVVRPVLWRRRRYARGLEREPRLAEDGRARGRDGSGGALHECGSLRKARACHLHRLRPHSPPRGDDRRRAPERLHPDDGARAQDLGQARKVTAEAPYFTALFAPKGWNKA